MVVDRPCVVGSAPEVDVRLSSPEVSRLHARLEPCDDGLWIEDLASTNGTFVDGVRVRAARIHPGARVALGSRSLPIFFDEAPTQVPLWPAERLGPLLGRTPVMRELFDRLARAAHSSATVLLLGETGTGKELAARALHDVSPRATGPFVVFDCGAVPEALFESDLFGHVRGSFTGAERAREGAALAASGGTLFLDEVGELPLSLQPKLLRFLEARTVRRVGETAPRATDVRVVAATHRDLARLVASGAFREDLFFRLAVLPITVPALRDRREDIPILIEHFRRGDPVDPETVRFAAEQAWTGNVRELRNFVERALVLGGEEARRATLPAVGAGGPTVDLDVPFKDLKERWNDHLEREYLRGWLARKQWNVKEVAEAIGLDRTYVHRLLKKHDLQR